MKRLRLRSLTTIRKFIYLFLYFMDKFMLHQKPDIFILCYHAIGNDNWRYGVSFKTLEKQLSYLTSHFTSGTMEDVEKVIHGEKQINKPMFVIAFDDGYKDVYQTKELFKKFKISPALFVLGDTERANHKELDNNRPFLSKEEILHLEKNGWIIGSHSATHANFDTLSEKELSYEIFGAKKRTEQLLGHTIKYLAYPKGRYTKIILSEMKKAGYTLGLSMNDGFINTHTDKYLVPRVGVDRTHTFAEFKAIFSPSSVRFRKFIKEHIGVIV